MAEQATPRDAAPDPLVVCVHPAQRTLVNAAVATIGIVVVVAAFFALVGPSFLQALALTSVVTLGALAFALGASRLALRLRSSGTPGEFEAVGRISHGRFRHLLVDDHGITLQVPLVARDPVRGSAQEPAQGPAVLRPGMTGPETARWDDLGQMTLRPTLWPYPSTYVVVTMLTATASWSVTVRASWAALLECLQAQCPRGIKMVEDSDSI